MAALAFLLAPETPFPKEHDQDWEDRLGDFQHLASIGWDDRVKRELTEDEGWDAPDLMARNEWRLTPRLGRFQKDAKLKQLARAYVDAEWVAWQASERTRLPTPNTCAHAAAVLGVTCRIGLSSLLTYRGGWKRLTPPRGMAHAQLHQSAALGSYDLLERSSTERTVLLELVRHYGGHALAVWTSGHAVLILVAHGAAAGEAPRVHGPFALRLRRTGPPDTALLPALREALSGAALTPDWDALAAQVQAPVRSVRALFEAFGVKGVRELVAEDGEALWADLEAAGTALLRGEAPDKQTRARLNAALAPSANTALPTKAGRPGKGDTSRKVAEVEHALRELVGPSRAPVWRARAEAARAHQDLLDGEARERLLTGEDTKGVGACGAAARYLAHHPASLARDPLFLARLALECEAANSHDLVETLEGLAECAHAAGLLAVALPAAQLAAFRKAMGLRPRGDAAAVHAIGGWAGEAFLLHPALTKADVAAQARTWLVKASVDAVVAELAPDGVREVAYLRGGRPADDAAALGLPPVDREALGAAARALHVRGAFPALGVGDVLAPGAWERRERPEAGPQMDADQAAAVSALLARADGVAPVTLTAWHPLPGRLGVRLRAEPSEDGQQQLLALSLRVPGADADALRELRQDFGDALFPGPGTDELRGSTDDLDVGFLAGMLADLPPGTALTLVCGEDGPVHHLVRGG